MTHLTYYQRKRDVVINRAKNYYQNDKKRLREQARDKDIYLKKIYLKTIRIKRKNTEETDTIICLKKETKTKIISSSIKFSIFIFSSSYLHSSKSLRCHYIFLFLFLRIYHCQHKQIYYQILFSIIFQLFSIFDRTFLAICYH